MGCNKYKFVDKLEFLAYANEGEKLEFPSIWNVELVEENVDPGKLGYCDLQIIHAPETWEMKRRTRDKRLEDEKILSYVDLANAFFLIKNKSLQKSKAVRDLIVEKYIEVLQFINLENDK